MSWQQDRFLDCLRSLGALWGGRAQAVEEALDDYEQRIAALSPDERQALKRDLDSIVGALARLSMRLRDR